MSSVSDLAIWVKYRDALGFYGTYGDRSYEVSWSTRKRDGGTLVAVFWVFKVAQVAKGVVLVYIRLLA